MGKSMRKKGKVGSSFRLRGLKTNRVINFKLRATLMSPEMIRASARFNQFRDRLSNIQTRNLVKEAEAIDELVFLIELNPNEGSGVIPLDWRVFIQPRGLQLGDEGAIKGKKSSKLRKVKALAGVFKRDYDYDVFFGSTGNLMESGKISKWL